MTNNNTRIKVLLDRLETLGNDFDIVDIDVSGAQGFVTLSFTGLSEDKAPKKTTSKKAKETAEIVNEVSVPVIEEAQTVSIPTPVIEAPVQTPQPDPMPVIETPVSEIKIDLDFELPTPVSETPVMEINAPLPTAVIEEPVINMEVSMPEVSAPVEIPTIEAPAPAMEIPAAPEVSTPAPVSNLDAMDDQLMDIFGK